MQVLFKIFSNTHAALYNATNGRLGGRFNGADILLLTTTGRKSGKQRTIPLMYVKDNDSYLVTGSAAGGPKHPGWYWNATKGSYPVRITVNDLDVEVEVREANGQERDWLYKRFIDMSNQFAGYEKKTERKIPVLILTPRLEQADDSLHLH